MRILLTWLLPLLLPTALYLGWMWVMRRRIAAAAGKGEAAEARARAVPWTWLALAGVVLTAVTLGASTLWQGASPGALYVPPHLENGRLVPGRMIEPP
ncbi:MAG: DUF6111 family protein [Alphaproteobacteria bacterium]